MFKPNIYQARRKKLRKTLKHGLILFLSNEEISRTYTANAFLFRQDSSFLYYFGLNSPGVAGLIDSDEDDDTLFGDDLEMADIVWTGPQPTLKAQALKAGVRKTAPAKQLEEKITTAIRQGRPIHYLPPYQAEVGSKLAKLLGISPSGLKDHASLELIRAVVDQRSRKIKEEIAEIEKALEVTGLMFRQALKMARPETIEREIVAAMTQVALSRGFPLAFLPIVTIHGETLHNNYYGNTLRKGDMLVCDAGAEAPSGYASDITRTLPVGRRFDLRQKEVYRIVLEANQAAIRAIKPGKKYLDIHLLAATSMAAGLKQLGLMKGNVAEAVKAGAHALFFPHGLGHMIGLDTHDMENLGEDHVGYGQKTRRSHQFGLGYLRLARELQPGFVLTVEPGIYFISELIAQWQAEKKFIQFINYEKVKKYRDFGGIRIEDNVVVTTNGCRVLGSPIPRTVAEIEGLAEK